MGADVFFLNLLPYDKKSVIQFIYLLKIIKIDGDMHRHYVHASFAYFYCCFYSIYTKNGMFSRDGYQLSVDQRPRKKFINETFINPSV